jgi:hypothetical protein
VARGGGRGSSGELSLSLDQQGTILSAESSGTLLAMREIEGSGDALGFGKAAWDARRRAL